MADEIDLSTVTKSCFTIASEDVQRWLIFAALLGSEGAGENVNVTNACLPVAACEVQPYALKVDITGGGGTPQTVARSVVSTSGSVTAGATSVTIFSSSDFVGTVAGAAFSASIAENFTAQPGSTLGAIAYTRSAGSLTISTIT